MLNPRKQSLCLGGPNKFEEDWIVMGTLFITICYTIYYILHFTLKFIRLKTNSLFFKRHSNTLILLNVNKTSIL